MVGGDFTDACWFPVDLHVPRREFGFLALDAAVLERSTFLDNRIDAPLCDASPVAVATAARPAMPVATLAWLFHTSFCGSTLLSRALHFPPYQTVLKEPLVLRRLGDARHSGWPLEGLIETSVQLLARPWHPDGAVVIKPTHAALNIAVDLLEAAPDSRGVILTSSLDDFLISNLKKSPETQSRIPVLAERALNAGTFNARLSPEALAPPDLIAAACLQWAAQRELCLDIANAVGPRRLRFLDMAELLGDLQATASRCVQWLGLPVPRNLLEQRIADVSQRNAKDIGIHYNRGLRASESEMVRAHYGRQIASARTWFDRTVRPVMRADAIETPVHGWADTWGA